MVVVSKRMFVAFCVIRLLLYKEGSSYPKRTYLFAKKIDNNSSYIKGKLYIPARL
jgi:hypothetical protein